MKLREEIHSAHFITKPGDLARIPKFDRLAIIRHFADHLAAMPHFNVINVVVKKQGKGSTYDIFEMAWKALIQRFENTIKHDNFSGPGNDNERGMIFPDNTDNKKLTKLMRKMWQYNPVPNQQTYSQGYRNLTLERAIEDPNFRNSEHSYFVQAADLCAFLLYQWINSNQYMNKKDGRAYFNRLDPILCKVALPRDPINGIVWL